MKKFIARLETRPNGGFPIIITKPDLCGIIIFSFYFLQRYLRDTQKEKCKPHQAHYFAVDLPDKKHLEHPIPQNKILQAYLDEDLTALEAIHMPLCLISDFDKHYLQGEWEHNATWELPFMRYKLAGLKTEIKNLRGDVIDFGTWTIEDHFDMLGISID